MVQTIRWRSLSVFKKFEKSVAGPSGKKKKKKKRNADSQSGNPESIVCTIYMYVLPYYLSGAIWAQKIKKNNFFFT